MYKINWNAHVFNFLRADEKPPLVTSRILKTIKKMITF